MSRLNKVISTIALFCFLLNATNYDLAFGQTLNYRSSQDKLAAPSQVDDIVGIQYKDKGRIKFALEEELRRVFGKERFIIAPTDELLVGMGFFISKLTNRTLQEKTIFQPADMQFFFSETKRTNAGLYTMVRLKDRYGLRTYYATFSLRKDEHGGFPIEVYTEEQYKGTAALTKIAPQIKAEDAKEIERYVQHEKGVDAVIRYAHEQGLAKEPALERFDYNAFVKRTLRENGIKLTNPARLIPIEKRKFFLVKLTKEIQDMIFANPGVIIDAEGREYTVPYNAHSSNNAKHVFVTEETFEVLTNRDYARDKSDTSIIYRRALNEVEDTLTYELGVPLGFRPVVDSSGKLWNELIGRSLASAKAKREFQANPLERAIVNLDHVKGREYYAAGEKDSTGRVSEEIAAMTSLASEAGVELSMERYNLLVTSEFFAPGELADHKRTYGDRFDLDSISGVSSKQLVDNILAKSKGKEARTIALVPDDLPDEQLKRLTKLGIRFIKVNSYAILKARVDKDANRKKFQIDTYAMMLLMRRIDDSVTAGSSIYRLLSFYLKTHFAWKGSIAIDDYIGAIVNNDFAKLIQGYLTYKPAKPHDVPAYHTVAETLISA
jgi:hypothetical protein